MIERYSLSPLKELWMDSTKFSIWLKIEILVCEALQRDGAIPESALKEIREKAIFEVARIEEIEKETRHDVIAFLTNVAENVGPSSRYIHLGLTSSDLLDTTLACQLKGAGEAILETLESVIDRLGELAVSEKDTPMIGRTHGVHAEPITLGLKFASWWEELVRQKHRLKLAVGEIAVGKISGAVGTYAYLEPAVEAYVMDRLGLKPSPVATQIVSRDRHAHFLSVIALLGASLEKFTTEIRHLQRTEVGELEEPFRHGQKGSSAMPHKKNPILCERIAGLARVLRGNAQAALENVSLWHERDITHSSVERVILPDSTILIHYMLTKFYQIIDRIGIDRDRMMANLRLTGGMIFSQGLLLSLVRKGMTREDAYRIVQTIAHSEGDTAPTFEERARKSRALAEHLSEDEISAVFDLKHHLGRVDHIFSRLGLSDERGSASHEKD
jgi:adenylosuccinate lyase